MDYGTHEARHGEQSLETYRARRVPLVLAAHASCASKTATSNIFSSIVGSILGVAEWP